jgi:hypothetical protein
MVGGFLLASELARCGGNPAAAFAACEARMRPFIAKNQAIANLTRDPRFSGDPSFYLDMIEPAGNAAESAIDLPDLDEAQAR